MQHTEHLQQGTITYINNTLYFPEIRSVKQTIIKSVCKIGAKT